MYPFSLDNWQRLWLREFGDFNSNSKFHTSSQLHLTAPIILDYNSTVTILTSFAWRLSAVMPPQYHSISPLFHHRHSRSDPSVENIIDDTRQVWCFGSQRSRKCVVTVTGRDLPPLLMSGEVAGSLETLNDRLETHNLMYRESTNRTDSCMTWEF
jgi:hypothetical protein